MKFPLRLAPAGGVESSHFPLYLIRVWDMGLFKKSFYRRDATFLRKVRKEKAP
jgi:hypothetical protein